MAAKDVPGSAPAHSALGGAQWTNCNWALLVSQHMKPKVPSLPSAYRPTSVNSHLDTHLAKGYFIGALGRGSIFFFALKQIHGISWAYTESFYVHGLGLKRKMERWHQRSQMGLAPPSSRKIVWFHFMFFKIWKNMLLSSFYKCNIILKY